MIKISLKIYRNDSNYVIAYKLYYFTAPFISHTGNVRLEIPYIMAT